MQRALMQELDSEPDSYWNQNSLSSFTFDDDKAGRLKKSTSKSPKEDNVETVDWSGNKVKPPISQPKQPHPQISSIKENSAPKKPQTKSNVTLSNLTTGSDKVKFSVLTNEEPNHLSARKSLTPSVSSMGGTAKTSSITLSPEVGRRRKNSGGSSVGSGSNSVISLSDESNRPFKREMTPVEFSRLDSEHTRLKLKFEQLRRGRYKAPEIKESISRLMRGEPAILEMYTKKEDKVSLLDSAIKSSDGNVIIKVVLYLKNSLSTNLFQEQILSKPDAASHYLLYLRDHYKFTELTQTLLLLGRKEEALMTEFKQAIRRSNAQDKINGLKEILSSGLGSDPLLKQEIDYVKEYCFLLERQIPIDTADDNDSRVGKNQRFKMYPKKASLIDQPVLTTLYYASLYHYHLPENSFASPLNVKKTHNLNEKQYCWVVMKALARQKLWDEIRLLLTSKGFYGLGASKIKSPVPYGKLLDALEKHGAPPKILGVYCRLVHESEERLKLAAKYKCHDVAVDCFVANRNRQGLIEYSSKLTSHTTEAYYAQAALNNSSNKWKN